MSNLTVQVSPKLQKFLQGPKKLFINGQFVESVSKKTFSTPNPATGQNLVDVYEADKVDIDLAVKAARTAFDEGPWSKMRPAARSRLIYRLQI